MPTPGEIEVSLSRRGKLIILKRDTPKVLRTSLITSSSLKSLVRWIEKMKKSMSLLEMQSKKNLSLLDKCKATQGAKLKAR